MEPEEKDRERERDEGKRPDNSRAKKGEDENGGMKLDEKGSGRTAG